mmetsp:Transcript_11303/g.13660  ORF Transcript_11303/g.13660 Transcript_11303/m.13660 type:complete len:282 (-) Transcript_11303:189-1034(-)
MHHIRLLTSPCLATTVLLIKLLGISTSAWVSSSTGPRCLRSTCSTGTCLAPCASRTCSRRICSSTKVATSAVSHHSTLHATHHHLAVHAGSSTLLHLTASHSSSICSAGTCTSHSISTVRVVHTSGHTHVLLCHTAVGTQVHSCIRIVPSSSHSTHGRIHGGHLILQATRHFAIRNTGGASGSTCAFLTSLAWATNSRGNSTVGGWFEGFTSHFSFLSSIVGLHIFLVTFGIFSCHLGVLGKTIGVDIFPSLADKFSHFFKANLSSLFPEPCHHIIIDKIL